MPRIAKRPPVFSKDADGTPIATVALANGGTATLDTADLESLLSGGFTANWTFNESKPGFAYVRAGRLVVVAREIMRPRSGECVKYRNGDRRDLRRANLYVTGGGRRKPHAQAAG
jgi:hypothetical protein